MPRAFLVLLTLAALTACRRDDGSGRHKKDTAGTDTSTTAAPGAHRPSAVPLSPPPLARPPSTPALPDLPPLSQHPRMAALPAKGADVHGCGQVWSGTAWMPVACVDPSRYPEAGKMAKVVVPYASLSVHPAHLPAVVDHRVDGTEGPVRQQHGPECTAFAFTAALDHALARWTGTPGHFSVMQVWARYLHFNEQSAAAQNVGQFVANEADWPYDAAEANGWIPCPAGADPKKVCGKPVDHARLDALERRPSAEITQIEAFSTSEIDALRGKLAAGQDATVAVSLPSFATAGNPGARYVPGVLPSGSTTRPKMGHQILLSGYAMMPHGTYYLIHNSFGPGWGDGGFAWIHEETLKTYWNDARIYVVDVEPVQVAKRKHRAHGVLTAPCPGEQVADSISGVCAPRCPDGSPRHDDICAVAGQCRAGLVNLTGQCLLAAPAGASGTDPATHVRWACGPGGCAYWLPQGQAGCTRKECSVSCPAPEFRLATGPKGIVCVE